MSEFATSRGRVRGAPIMTPDGQAIAVLGIPTARVPDRFRPAVPPDPWRGVRESKQGPLAWQAAGPPAGLTMDEEGCLTANVWLPGIPPVHPSPVLIWVHGGAHVAGSNADPLCDGARLAAKYGVIVVAIAYRLGAFGHLRLDHLLGEEYADAGNLALRDVVAGVAWVRDEIAGFGGDPRRITVMGQSAGGAIVATLLAECGGDGLFQRVIIGSATAERTHTLDQAAEVTTELLSDLGGGADPRAVLRAPPGVLIAAQQRVVSRWQLRRSGPATPFRPIVDGRFVHGRPVDRIAAGAGSSVDAIIGTVRNEASAHVDLLRLDDREATSALRAALRDDGRDGDLDSYLAACRRDDGAPLTPAEALESYITDREYRGPMLRLIEARLAARARTYAYLFAWNRADTGAWARRAGHSLELPFVFRHLEDSDQAREQVGAEAPIALRDLMSAAWATFAGSGRPDDDGECRWPMFQDARETIVFDRINRLANDPFAARRRWLAKPPR
ncbi:carboxylesterase family protein [Microbacterium sp. NPDC089320]|uniref:carboxylesterase/lipase family protein n=1 Tax=Microbacterium sp. NPDC089320 TaxID=3155182 RepID=UPI003426F545